MALIKESPTLSFTLEAWQKLQGFLRLSQKEISGFGRVLPVGNGSFLVDELFLLPQEVTSSHTRIDMLSVGLFVASLIENGENPENIKLWWHSHVDFGLFWSPIDDANMRELTQTYMFGIVGSRKGEIKARLDIAEPPLTIDEIPIGVDYLSAKTRRWCLREMKKNVVETPPPPHHPSNGASLHRLHPSGNGWPWMDPEELAEVYSGLVSYAEGQDGTDEPDCD